MKMKLRQGFTLIEILIVVAIISILAGIVLVGLRPATDQARDVRRASELKQLQTALQIYYTRWGAFPGALNDLVTGGAAKIVPLDPTNQPYGYTNTTDGSYNLGILFEGQRGTTFQDHVGGITAGPVDCNLPNAYCLKW